MLEDIFKLTEYSQNVSNWVGYACLVTLLVIIFGVFVCALFKKMSFMILEKREKIVKKKYKNSKEQDLDLQKCDSRYEIYTKCANATFCITRVLAVVCMVISVLVIIYLVRLNSLATPSSSYIHKVEMDTTPIEVIGYYETKIEGIDKKVVTLFIHNNSDKIVISGKLVENNSYSSQPIEYLHPTEDRIISIVVDSLDQEDYDFEFKDIVEQDT